MSVPSLGADGESISDWPSLRIPDYIPILFISKISGVARMIFGIAEAWVGYHSPSRRYLLNDGAANIVRGFIACSTGWYGNLALFIYDYSGVVRERLRQSVGLH